MSGTESKNIRTLRYVSKNDIGVCSTGGEMVNQRCPVHRPLPCIVILVQGVNDVGEACQNQDEGICAGLNDRLGRNDLHPHNWIEHEFMISDTEGKISVQTCSVEKQTCVGVVNRSPIIPFYWGYKPVDHAAFIADQQRYREELKKKQNETDLPYDTYQQDDARIKKNHDNQNTDNLNNWLDPGFAKGGGTFANATTNIPDMFGPGANGAALEIIGKFSRSRMNNGDWSHPIYSNPHRIYQAYAARRLADLILAIRRNESTRNDTINIVAHSQGTIITMLANMWVKAEGLNPADCVILNNSPYSLESRTLENAQPGNQQTSQARQKTLANFCKLMATNSRYNAGKPHDAADIKQLFDTTCLHRVNRWSDTAFSRNNFGMVYNYFCPNDQVVSMLPVQGFGWSGVGDGVRNQLGENFNQRVFCKDVPVGDKTHYHFSLPEKRGNDPEKPIEDKSWDFEDVTVNAPVLPEPFTFVLQGQDSEMQSARYKYKLSGNDRPISRAVMKAERFITGQQEIPNSPAFYGTYGNNSPLNEKQLSELQARLLVEDENKAPGERREIVDGRITGNPDGYQYISYRRRMTEEELTKALQVMATYSQHSSIVCNASVPRMAVAYDLAIGQNRAFENQKFWDSLLLQADWRRGDLNPLPEVQDYYKHGLLPEGFKKMMNKPEYGEHPMPTGKFGVVNDYGPRQRVQPGTKRDVENKMVDILQWDMPKPQV